MRARSPIWLACLLLTGCGSEAPDDAVNAALGKNIPRVVTLQEALTTPDIPTLDPHSMNDAEIAKVLGAAPFCAFRYVSDGQPALAWTSSPVEGRAPAVLKLNGGLVALQHESGAGGMQFVADELHMQVTPDDAQESVRSDGRPQEAKLLFEIGQELRVGYGGYLVCPP